ncbi:MAG: class I SAM-dependent methyltransferase [Gemmatimonadetes bacterium]|nr:class I SAM-dependent methyltransferase [Gemmatimonadota bacterium]
MPPTPSFTKKNRWWKTCCRIRLPIEEYTGPQAQYYDQYFTGIDGDLDFYLLAAGQAGSPILELGCGSGRILIPIAETGKAVVGIERSAQMLRQLRLRLAGLRQHRSGKANAIRGDMRDFRLREQFALVIVPYRAFQHLLTDADQRRCLQRIREHLRPGGALVFDTFDCEFLDEQPEPALDTSFSAGGGLTVGVRYTRHIDTDAGILRQQLIFDERDENGRLLRSRTTALLLRCCSRVHMEGMLRASGFEVAALYGGFRGEPVAEGGVQVWVAVEGK